jgi:DNA-binding CsgD family transcriptional regulator
VERASLPLLERTDELEAVERALARAHDSAGSLLLVEGRPGLGKSRLIAAASERAGHVLGACGDEGERQLAFGVVLQLFERAARSELFDGAAALARPLFEGEAEGRDLMPLLHGLYWLTANLAEDGPLLLTVDDAHWADEPSLRFLRYLAQRLDELPVVLLVATRPSDAQPPLLRELAAHPAARVLTLAPLGRESVTRAVRAAVDVAAADAFCDACAEVTGGNPFLLAELAAEIDAEGLAPTAASVDRVRQLTPESLSRRIVARLGRLGREADALARALAVLRESSPLRHVARVAELDRDVAAAAADTLVAADILAGDGDTVAFVHPLVRAAVYADIGPARRGELHDRAARVLAVDGEPPDRVATQLLGAPTSGRAATVATLRRAAERALGRAAPASAATYLSRALDEPPPADLRPAVAAELARALARAGAPESSDAFADALALIEDPAERAELMLGWARDHLAQGRYAAAADTIDRGLADLDGRDRDLDLQLRAEYFPIVALDSALSERAQRVMPPLLEAIDREPLTRAHRSALAAMTFQAALTGAPVDEVRSLAMRALGDGALLAEETSEGSAIYSVTLVLNAIDELELQERVLSAAVEDAHRRGSVMAFATASACRAGPRYLQGKLAEATDDAQRAIDAQRYGWDQLLPMSYSFVALARLDAGDPAGARAALDEADRPELRGMVSFVPVLEALGRYELAAGDPRAALRHFEAWGEVGVWPNPGLQNAWRSHAALALLALGEVDRARELAAEEVDLARRASGRRTIGAALRAQGLVEGGERGIALLRESAAVLEHSPGALDRSRALVDLGAALRRAGRRAEARDHLESGRALAHRLGAWRIAEQAEAELAAAGARPRAAAGAAASSQLTPSELRIAHMAADGMKNREIAQALFVTVKAVEWHLANAYRKLGISSRAQLGAALSQAD